MSISGKGALEVYDDVSEAIGLFLATGPQDQALMARMLEGL